MKFLNVNKYEFYFHKKNVFYLIKPIGFEFDKEPKIMFGDIYDKPPKLIFDDFKVYFDRDDYIDDCLEAYQAYRNRFIKKSAYSFS
tara:strand:+ start:208 stop:465 length:258 start_codon:yes stop_codon:yes gene_type:complete